MEFKFKAERNKNWLKETLVFAGANVLYAGALTLLHSPLNFLETLFWVVLITGSVSIIQNGISFFTDNKFEFKLNKKEEV